MLRSGQPDAEGESGAAPGTPCARCGSPTRIGSELWTFPACSKCVTDWYDADHPRRATMSELALMTPEERAAVYEREQKALHAWTAAWVKRGAR